MTIKPTACVRQHSREETAVHAFELLCSIRFALNAAQSVGPHQQERGEHEASISCTAASAIARAAVAGERLFPVLAWDLSFREELHAIDAVVAGQGIAICSNIVII